MRSKINKLYVDSLTFPFHVVVFTETWLKPDILDSEIFSVKYTTYRLDRPSQRGGGVLIAVDSNLSSEEIPFVSPIDIEFISIKICFRGVFLYVTCSYISPSSDISVYHNHLSAIQSVNNLLSDKDHLIVLGDFNLPRTTWLQNNESNSLTPTTEHGFIDGLFDISLCQINHVKNSLSRQLDLCFVCDPASVVLSRTEPLTYPEDPYHPTLELVIDLGTSVTNFHITPTVRVRQFRKADFTKLNELLSQSEWSDLYVCTDLSIAIKLFYNRLNACFDACIPSAYPTRSNKPPWFSKELSHLKNLKSRLYKKFKESSSSSAFSRYLIARANFIELNAMCYRNYLSRCRVRLAKDPRQFFNFVNTKRQSSSYPSSLSYENSKAYTDQAIADLFATFFQTTYSSSNYSFESYPFDMPRSNCIFSPLISEESLIRDLEMVKPVFSPGPDGVPGCVLRYGARALCGPLLKLFSLSLDSAIFPSIWKESFIIPLHKKGSKSDAKNYRGISKLSAIPKVFEKILTSHLQHLCCSIISPYQHGFVKRRSTTTNLLELSSFVIRGFRNNKQTDVIYTDFSKAFDSVNHSLLLHKLDIIGFPTTLIRWISSYLKHRTQKVLFNNFFSKSFRVTSGVPQGSHLGPLLFTLFINDLPTVLRNSRVLMYADDVKICLQYKDWPCHFKLQEDLDSFQSWCRVNLLNLNCSKCNVMTFYRTNPYLASYSLYGGPLDRITAVDDLGILLDHKLKFSDHIFKMVNKAMSVLGFIKRWSKEFDDPYITKTLYISLVRPILEYGSCVWCPQYTVHQSRIESVQKNFLLFALRGLNWNRDVRLPSYSSRLLLIDLPSLSNRRIMLGIIFMCKLIGGDIDSTELMSQLNFSVPRRVVSRNFIPISLPICRSNYALHEPFRMLCSEYNRLFYIVSEANSISNLKILLLTHLANNN